MCCRAYLSVLVLAGELAAGDKTAAAGEVAAGAGEEGLVVRAVLGLGLGLGLGLRLGEGLT